VIKKFRHRGLKRLFEQEDMKGIRPDLVEKVENILSVLDSVSGPHEIDIPGYRLHPLRGDRKGQWSITVRSNWRVIFRFEGRDVVDVDFVDYH
jgi:proteic killer suppression protein